MRCKAQGIPIQQTAPIFAAWLTGDAITYFFSTMDVEMMSTDEMYEKL